MTVKSHRYSSSRLRRSARTLAERSTSTRWPDRSVFPKKEGDPVVLRLAFINRVLVNRPGSIANSYEKVCCATFSAPFRPSNGFSVHGGARLEVRLLGYSGRYSYPPLCFASIPSSPISSARRAEASSARWRQRATGPKRRRDTVHRCSGLRTVRQDWRHGCFGRPVVPVDEWRTHFLRRALHIVPTASVA